MQLAAMHMAFELRTGFDTSVLLALYFRQGREGWGSSSFLASCMLGV